MKTCRVCKRELPDTAFYHNRLKCKECTRPEHRANLRGWQLKQYGLTAADYQRMFDEQSGACAICGTLAGTRSLCVDHDHETGIVRGLLCIGCNTALGSFKDSIANLRNAVKYLTEIHSA